jgi:DNA-binding response OmpR family regulator
MMPVSQPNRPLAGRSVLIVEDEPLIALEVHAAFSAAGASITSAADTQEGLRMIDAPGLSAAVVDINLGRGDCTAVCERLSRNGVPFVFYTGDARPDILLKWPNAPVLTKLVDKERMVAVVANVLR